MYYREFGGINAFLVGMARLLLKEAVVRETRGFKCYELASPVMIKITNPTARIVTIPAREWNCTLPYVESLWLASGRNDINMVASYVKKMLDFSDDKLTMRAGYGPRLRYFTGVSDDYNNGYLHEAKNLDTLNITEVDQFEFVEKTFKKDPFTRQAIITIGDPSKDCFGDEHILKQTKDFPCTRDLQFIQSNGRLDLIVHMRSNDFIWGASGVNIFNFTFIQEYFAKILGLPIGNYYHLVNNFHYYEDKRPMVENIANTENYNDEAFLYHKSFSTLAEFDERLMAFE
jgi:thymidylate synthase